MADVIKVVKGDELPIITLTLTDDVANTPLDLSNINTTVSVKFRAVNTTTVQNLIMEQMVKLRLILQVVY